MYQSVNIFFAKNDNYMYSRSHIQAYQKHKMILDSKLLLIKNKASIPLPQFCNRGFTSVFKKIGNNEDVGSIPTQKMLEFFYR